MNSQVTIKRKSDVELVSPVPEKQSRISEPSIFDELDEKCIRLIFSNLALQDLFSVRLVSRKWKQIATLNPIAAEAMAERVYTVIKARPLIPALDVTLGKLNAILPTCPSLYSALFQKVVHEKQFPENVKTDLLFFLLGRLFLYSSHFPNEVKNEERKTIIDQLVKWFIDKSKEQITTNLLGLPYPLHRYLISSIETVLQTISLAVFIHHVKKNKFIVSDVLEKLLEEPTLKKLGFSYEEIIQAFSDQNVKVTALEDKEKTLYSCYGRIFETNAPFTGYATSLKGERTYYGYYSNGFQTGFRVTVGKGHAFDQLIHKVDFFYKGTKCGPKLSRKKNDTEYKWKPNHPFVSGLKSLMTKLPDDFQDHVEEFIHTAFNLFCDHKSLQSDLLYLSFKTLSRDSYLLRDIKVSSTFGREAFLFIDRCLYSESNGPLSIKGTVNFSACELHGKFKAGYLYGEGWEIEKNPLTLNKFKGIYDKGHLINGSRETFEEDGLRSSYLGTFSNSLPDGFGTMKSYSKRGGLEEEYTGHYKKGMRDGQGALILYNLFGQPVEKTIGTFSKDRLTKLIAHEKTTSATHHYFEDLHS